MSAVTKIKRKAPAEWDQKQLRVFNLSSDEYQIKQFAKGMEPEEVLAWYGLERNDLPPYDEWFFDVTFKRGRLEAKKESVDKLFANMSSQKGLEASLAYLTRFGNERWQSDKNTDPGKVKGLKIILTDSEGNEV